MDRMNVLMRMNGTSLSGSFLRRLRNKVRRMKRLLIVRIIERMNGRVNTRFMNRIRINFLMGMNGRLPMLGMNEMSLSETLLRRLGRTSVRDMKLRMKKWRTSGRLRREAELLVSKTEAFWRESLGTRRRGRVLRRGGWALAFRN